MKLTRFALASLVLLCSAAALAQMAPFYQVNYYSRRNNTAGADASVNIINPGTTGAPSSADHGTLCADIYVFNSRQSMIECCSCPISANGMIELSIARDLTGNPVTGLGTAPDSGVIKIVSDAANVCNATAPSSVSGLVARATHLKQLVSGGPISATEDEFQFVSNVSPAEMAFLGNTCRLVRQLGSGKGVCTCGVGG